MGNWNQGLYQLSQQLGGTYLGHPSDTSPSALMLLDYRGKTLAVHGYQTRKGRGYLRGNTCVTVNLPLQVALSLELHPKNWARKWVQGAPEWDAPAVERGYEIETQQEQAARRLLRSPALGEGLLACPKTELLLSPVCETEGAVLHMLRVRTAYIQEEWSWTDTETLADLRPIQLVERMVAVARAACDALLEYRL